MKLNNSNKRYSIYIAGILVFVLLFIFMGVIIGCWGNCSYEQEGTPSVFPPNLDIDTGNINSEPAAQSPDTWQLDTDYGTFTIVKAGFYNSTGDLLVDLISKDGQFPLCFGQGYYFNFTVETYGGYSPCELAPYRYNYVEITQCKRFNVYNNYKIYYDYTVWTELPNGDCTDTWEGIIDVDQCISLDSNHKPDCSGELNKKVKVKLKTAWQGCHLPEQCFYCYKEWRCLDTEKGTLEILPYGLANPNTILDLCYESGDVFGTLFVHSVGGYSPKDDDILTIEQEKDGETYALYDLKDVLWTEYDEVSDYDATVFGGILDLDDFTLLVDCCGSLFVGEVTIGSNVFDQQSGQAIPGFELASNHVPAGCCPSTKTLGKLVNLTLVSEWEGCGQVSQEFTLMLVHKNNISGVPNSRYFIAGCKRY
jgi:hypothetical protein